MSNALEGLERREINLRGLRTSFLWQEAKDPQAPLLFFLHGFPDKAEAWSQQIAYFSESYGILAPTRGV